jgi:hypothetical protein
MDELVEANDQEGHSRQRAAPGRAWRRWATALMVGAWLALLVVPPVLLLRGREQWLERLARPAAQADWDAFRADMRRQAGRAGPVQRKVPKSAEPPARVWLRDYVGLAIVAWILFVGVLGGFFCLLAAGAIASRGPGGRFTFPGSAAPSGRPPETARR